MYKKITKEELEQLLRKHKLWLDNNPNGERAYLCGADLCGADLGGADLRNAVLRDADMRYAYLRNADLRYASLCGADLRDADMRYAYLFNANLGGADLCGANIDYSCLPLWCGSLDAHFDDKQLTQIAYHLVKAGLNSKNASKKTKAELAKLIDFANGFHRVRECGQIEHK